MLDPDISTADARRLLSQPGHLGDLTGPNGWTRRKFLAAIGGGVLGGAALGQFGSDRFGLGRLGLDMPEAFAATPIGAHDGIVVNIVLYGGNDGLNTVVPYTNGKYYDIRGPANGNLAIPAAQVLPLDGTYGLHPSLAYMKRVWDAGQLAIVHGVGYPNPDLSHFTSMAIWMAAHVRRRCAGHRLDRPLARWSTGGHSRPDGRDDWFFRASPPAGCGAPRRRSAAARSKHVRHRDRSGRRSHVQRPAGRCRRAPAGRGPWHDMFASVVEDTTQPGDRCRAGVLADPEWRRLHPEDDGRGAADQRQPRLPCARSRPRQLRYARQSAAETMPTC